MRLLYQEFDIIYLYYQNPNSKNITEVYQKLNVDIIIPITNFFVLFRC